MRRLPRIRRPSTVLTTYLQPLPPVPLCRATAATNCCVASRPRDFSTTPSSPSRASRSRAKDKRERPEVPLATAAETQPTAAAPDAPLLAENADLKGTTAEAQLQEPTASSPAQAAPEILPSAAALPPLPDVNPPATFIKLPPRQRSVAPRADELQPETAYEPALTAAKLPVVGGLGKWFEAKKKRKEEQSFMQENFGASQHFVPFAPGRTKCVSVPAVLELCTQRAVLEALAVEAVGPKTMMLASWSAKGGWDRALGLGVEVDEHGTVKLLGDVRGVVEGLQGNAAERERMKTPAEAVAILQKSHHAWKKVLLENWVFKFAVAKRVLQLTGVAIADAKLLHITDVPGFLATLIKPPPARRVYEAVARRNELNKLPNVSVYEKRRTPIHEAQALGRWKVAKAELAKRGLLKVDRSLDKSREREWYRGPVPLVKDNATGRRRSRGR